MPIYDYKCKSCGKVMEVFQRTVSEKMVTCSNCGSPEMEKLISAPGAILKEKTVPSGTTCCGRDERCQSPPCASSKSCRRGK